MNYVLVLEEKVNICPYKKIEVKPTKELVNRFCDFLKFNHQLQDDRTFFVRKCLFKV